jgi:hypothetical protein
MKYLIQSLLVTVLVFAPGCCTTRDAATGVSTDSYREAISRIRTNIAEIRSDVAMVDYTPEIKEADLQLIDATITLCDDTLAGKNAGAETSGQ